MPRQNRSCVPYCWEKIS